MKKILALSLLSLSLVGCAPMAYEVSASTPGSTNYYYDNDYDYYDGAYGNYVGGVYYVYTNNGHRYKAPPPRYSRPPRFSQKGWDGFRPGDKFHPPFYKPAPSYKPTPSYPSNSYPSRPQYTPDRPDLKPSRPSNPNNGMGRPQYPNSSFKPEAKPVPPIMYDSRPYPGKGNSGRDDEGGRDRSDRPDRPFGR